MLLIRFVQAVILVVSFEAFGDVGLLVNKRVDDRVLAQFHQIASFDSSDEILAALVQTFPEVRVVVLDQDIAVREIRGDLIHFRDTRVQAHEEQAYFDYTRGMTQSIGYHIAAQVQLKAFPDRPLSDDPLIVLKNRAPRHAIIHEVLHFINHRTPYLPYVELPEDPHLRVELQRIYDGIGEEVSVDSYLLQNKELFRLTDQDICFRARYLNQNLQVFDSFLRELSLMPKAGQAAEQVRGLKQAATESRKLISPHKLKCGIFPLDVPSMSGPRS